MSRVIRPREFLTTGQVCEYLSINYRTLQKYIAEGQIPAYRVGTRNLRIDLADLESFVRRVSVGSDK